MLASNSHPVNIYLIMTGLRFAAKTRPVAKLWRRKQAQSVVKTVNAMPSGQNTRTIFLHVPRYELIYIQHIKVQRNYTCHLRVHSAIPCFSHVICFCVSYDFPK
jgi:hypothetical protein